MPLYFLQSAIPSASGAPKTSTMFFVKKAPYAQSSLLLSVGTERRGNNLFKARTSLGPPRSINVSFFFHHLGVVWWLFFLFSEYFIALLAPKRAEKAQHASKNCRHALLFVNRPQVSDITHPSAPCRESLWFVCRVLRNSFS